MEIADLRLEIEIAVKAIALQFVGGLGGHGITIHGPTVEIEDNRVSVLVDLYRGKELLESFAYAISEDGKIVGSAETIADELEQDLTAVLADPMPGTDG